ncbi:MAG: NAD(P)-binding domain-containing protein [Hyphomicrobiaceae bacterium]
MKHITTVVVGAGHSGLAMSKHLLERGIDHVVLERGRIANSWRTERWDSLRLLTPNWQCRLPGHVYSGPDPNGYMTMPELVAHLQCYADLLAAPVETYTTVLRVSRASEGFVVRTDRGTWACRSVVLASGACNLPVVPALVARLPATIASMTPLQYRAPHLLSAGGVMIVGASATGVQLAREIRASGREVVLAVGEHVRLPRTYRGRDIDWWMDVMGLMDVRYDEIDDLDRARRLPSPQLIGTPGRETIDLNALRAAGVEIVGRLVGLDGAVAKFSGALRNHCALADLKMNRLLSSIDAWVASNAGIATQEPPYRFEPTLLSRKLPLSLDLRSRRIETIIWATGYRPDYSWLDVPVLDPRGRIRHRGGIVEVPGLYVLGLPFMRRRKSSFIDGAGDDAQELAAHMATFFARAAA